MRLTIAATRSGDISSVIGTPATVEYRGSGTIVSPWPPRTVAWMFVIETPSSIAMNARMRALSRMPAIPITFCFGSFVMRRTTSHIASRGFVTTMTLRSREPRVVFEMQLATISSFFLRRSSRDMPGLRARPAVRITRSDPSVSS